MLLQSNSNWSFVDIPKLHMSFTITFTVLYSLIFIMAYIQLWVVLYLRNKLVSTQTIYFLLCCIFTSQRIILFSFFYEKENNHHFNPLLYWILVTFPIVVQYMIALLITVFYYRMYVKSTGVSPSLTRLNILCIISPIFIMFVLNLFPIWFKEDNSKDAKNYFIGLSIRIIGTDLTFIATILFFIYIYRKFPQLPNAKLVHETKRITKARSIIVGIILVSVLALKLTYDITALIYYNKGGPLKLATGIEKENFVNINKDMYPFIYFGIVLFLWEIIPLIVVMLLFRVHFPKGVCIIGRATTYKEVNSNLYCNSTITNSSSTTKSKFIGVPRYGTLNSYYNSPEGSSSQTPGFFGSSNILQYPNYSFENSSKHILRNNIHPHFDVKEREGTIQTRSYKPNFNRLIKPGIWRSTSNTCLLKNKMVEEKFDPKTTSAHLSTAKEEQ